MNCPDYLVCVCMGVMYSDIYAFLLESDSPSFDSVKNCLQVATGCNSCVDEVHAIVADVLRIKKINV